MSVKVKDKDLNLKPSSEFRVLLVCVHPQSTYSHIYAFTQRQTHTLVLIKFITVYFQIIWVIINTHCPSVLKDTEIAMNHPYDVVTTSFGSTIAQTSKTGFS